MTLIASSVAMSVAFSVAIAIAQGQAPDSGLVDPIEAQAVCSLYDGTGSVVWDAAPADFALLWQRTSVVLGRIGSRGIAQAERQLDAWCASRAAQLSRPLARP